MGKTIAEALHEEGERAGRLGAKREILLRLLRLRFKKVPAAIEAKIQATDDAQQLDTWFDEFATARKLSDVDFDA
jgi:hypothetical protein